MVASLEENKEEEEEEAPPPSANDVRQFRRPPRLDCPHCPIVDPLQYELETTSFYPDGFSSDEDPEDDLPPVERIPGETCAECGRELDEHAPPYGPWCSGEPAAARPAIRRFLRRNLTPHAAACLGFGGIGGVFVATYRQRRRIVGAGKREEDVIPLAVKRIGGDGVEVVFGRGTKSIDPYLTDLSFKMEKLHHRNLVKIYSIVDGNKLVMERCQGDLLSHLREETTKATLNCQHLLYVSFQIAAALAYLEENAVFHGRLTARNVLIGEISKCKKWIHVKVTDFGVPISPSEDPDRLLPWMAPERVTVGAVTPSTDVWSFAVVLHEVFSFGKPPYGALNAVTLRKWVVEGYTMIREPEISDGIFSIMKRCWSMSSILRPTFRQLRQILWRHFLDMKPEFWCPRCRERIMRRRIRSRRRLYGAGGYVEPQRDANVGARILDGRKKWDNEMG